MKNASWQPSDAPLKKKPATFAEADVSSGFVSREFFRRRSKEIGRSSRSRTADGNIVSDD